MNKLKAIIIDDEPLARELIKSYLIDHPAIELIAECGDGFQGLKTIQELKPELIFIDVQMPKITGFEMLELVENPPIVIFTTAYNEFAIKAFEMNAVDYLLKPFARERFKLAIEKAKENHRLKQNQPMEKLQTDLQQVSGEKLQRIVVKNGAKIHVLPANELIYLEAQDDYVMLYSNEGKYLKEQTMKYFETNLDANQFIRIHRSYIVNVNNIKQLEHYEKESYRLILSNKAVLPVSKTGYVLLKKLLNI